MKEKENAVAVVDAKPVAIKLTPQAIAIIAENVSMAETLVSSVLEHDVDYGTTPGTQRDGLWDPGASKIMAAFNCYPLHEVIFHEESDELINYTIQAKLINRTTQEIFGTGIGGCSTRETKYGFRWVKNPKGYGYTEAEIAELKTRPDKRRPDEIEYRIENPEVGSLTNTIPQMAAKRAECDAAKSLPGVGSALRKLFDPELKKGLAEEPDYKHFWSIVKGMGISEKSAHQALGVSSMKEWVGAGHTLDEAIMAIGKKLTELVRKTTGTKTAKAATRAEKPAEQPVTHTETQNDGGITLDQMDAKQVPNTDALEFYVHRFWKMGTEELYRQLGYRSKQNFEEARVQKPWDAFLVIKEMKQGPPIEEEQEVIEPEELPF